MNETCKTNYKEMLPGFLAYIVVVIGSVYLLGHAHLGHWKIPVAVTPVLPVLMILRAMMNSFRRMDELQARIYMESLAFAFASTALLTLTYGFLQNAGFPNVNWVWVWVVMGSTLMVGSQIAKRKYR